MYVFLKLTGEFPALKKIFPTFIWFNFFLTNLRHNYYIISLFYKIIFFKKRKENNVQNILS